MHKDKVQYTKHHLLRNIIRQQAAKAKVYSVVSLVISCHARAATILYSSPATQKDNASQRVSKRVAQPVAYTDCNTKWFCGAITDLY